MKVVFIPKPGKDDYSTAKAFRPITLSNFMLKALERIMQWEIEERVLRSPLTSQHAYTKGLSTETALSQATDIIERSIYQGQCTLAVSFDCTGAFDYIKFDSADKAMQDIGIPEHIRGWYKNLLRQRTVTGEVNGQQLSVHPTKGSPQGGVLSPVVWNIIMNTLLNKFNGAVKAVGYADDILLLVSGLHPHSMTKIMQEAIKTVLEWDYENGLSFNPAKSSAMVFSKDYKLRSKHFPALYMEGKILQYATEMKYLGLTYDPGLTWLPHIQEKAAKCIRIWNMAKAVIGRDWGLTSEKITWIYEVMVRPIIAYGSLVWAHVIDKKSCMRILNSIQRKALLSLTKAQRSTPTAGMEVILGIPPLDLHIKAQATQTRWRTKPLLTDTWDGVGNLPNRRGHRLWHDKALREAGINMKPDHIRGQLIWVTNQHPNPVDTYIYTDGSKDEHQRTGAGWTTTRGDVVLDSESVRINQEASVFQAEVVAIRRVMEHLQSDTKITGNVVVRSDSQAAIAAIMNPLTTSCEVEKCKQSILSVKQSREVFIEWCRGHNDLTGNEYADHLAKEGAAKECVDILVGAPLSYVKSKVRDLYRAKWCERYKGGTDMSHTRRFCSEPAPKKIMLSRENLKLLVQVLTGHGPFRAHMSKWCAVSSICDLCEEEDQTAEHLLKRCPALARERHEVTETNSMIINLFKFEKVRRAMQANLNLV